MVKYTLKKRNNKSKIKRKVKKSIKKTFKKSLKNRKKVFRKSINKKTKNYKKKKEGGFLGFGEGKTCIEVGTTNNNIGINKKGAPFDYFGTRVYPFIKDNKDKKNYEHTVIDFIKTFLSDYPNSKSKLGMNPFTERIDLLLSMHAVDAHADAYNISNNKNGNIGYPLKDDWMNPLNSFFPYKYTGKRKSTETFKEEVETLRIRIFNLIMHEFDNMTCNVDYDTYRNKNNEEFAQLSTTDKPKSGETNIPKITSIKQFFEAFPTLKLHYKFIDENKITGVKTKQYKYMNIIRVALNRRSSGIDFI